MLRKARRPGKVQGMGGEQVNDDEAVFELDVEMLGSDEARALIERAREAGAVSQDEIVGALDNLDLDADQIDDFYRALEALEVDVVLTAWRRRSCSTSPRARSPPTRCSCS